jgi:hypothetical protein
MKRVRVQLDLHPNEAEGLDAMKDNLGLRSRADAVRTALAILEWVDRESASGRRIVSVGSEYVTLLDVPGIMFRGIKEKEGG